jgi:hypothetical protein
MAFDPAATGSYPISVRFDRDQPINRLWGIPILGFVVRWIVLIPHYIVLAVYGFVVVLLLFVTWIPVLLSGRFPGWGYDLLGGYYRWSTRVTAYQLLMVGPYPPFTTMPGYPVEVDFDRSTTLNNLWGIPLFGILVRALLVIPHVIVLWFASIVVGLIVFFSWIPVLLYGRYPQLGYELVGGYLRWTTRVSGWILLMAGPYPPFRLAE